MRIGFIGLGIMGRPMALNLLKNGYALTVWARRKESMRALSEAGAETAQNPASLARNSDIVISMVADAPDVEEVMLGKYGVSQTEKPNLIAIDMSTIAPSAARRIGAQLTKFGIDFLDAPVSGGETGAITGSLSIMVGGSESTFNRVKPVLSSMGKNITHIGPIGDGQIAKAANQILTGVGVLAVAEALYFAQQAGADAAKIRTALLGGFAASRILENHGQRMLERHFAPGFKSWMHQKDLHIVMQTAQELGLTLPATCTTTAVLDDLVNAGYKEEDSIAVLKLLENMAHKTN